MFGEFDKVAKSDALLHNPEFGMAVANLKETFDTFLARYTSAITTLDFTDRHKISNLRWTLSERLRFKMADGTTYTSFSQYVSRCRQCDLDLRQADSFCTRNRSDKNNKFGSKLNTPESLTENSVLRYSDKERSIYRSGWLKERLMKEGRCFKCGKRGHRSIDLDAQCQGQSAVSDEQLSLKLERIKRRTSSHSDSEK